MYFSKNDWKCGGFSLSAKTRVIILDLINPAHESFCRMVKKRVNHVRQVFVRVISQFSYESTSYLFKRLRMLGTDPMTTLSKLCKNVTRLGFF